METKLFEVRDHCTFLPVMATEISGCDGWLARRAGYGARRLMLVCKLTGHPEKITYSPYDWDSRTMREAHAFIENNWDELADGDLIDVRCLLGEADTPCQSERTLED